jgi:hypothetical protein
MGRKARLKNPADIRRFLGKIANEIHQGTLNPAAGGKAAYAISILLKAIEADGLEERLTKIEEAIDEHKN